jgi:hypothetical protein
VKGYEKEIVMRNPVSAPMTELVIVIHGKRSTITEIGTGLEIGTEEGTEKRNMAVTVTVIVIVVIETGTGTGIVVGIMIERRTVAALMTATVREAGTVREITNAQVMNVTAVTCMRGMLIMPMVSRNMTETWLIMGRIMAITSMSNTKVTRHMVMVKMDVGMKLSAQSDMSMTIIRHNQITQNLKALRKVRHTRKVTTSITKQKYTRLKLDQCNALWFLWPEEAESMSTLARASALPLSAGSVMSLAVTHVLVFWLWGVQCGRARPVLPCFSFVCQMLKTVLAPSFSPASTLPTKKVSNLKELVILLV